MRGQTAAYYRTEAKRVRFEAYFVENESLRRQLLALAADFEELADTVEAINQGGERLAS